MSELTMVSGENIMISLRYKCPCEAGECFQAVDTINLEAGERAFMEAARRLYRETIKEIEDHKADD